MAKTLFVGPEAVCVPYIGRREDGTPVEGESYGSVEGQRVGNDIYEMINEALREKAEDDRVRAVARCLKRFPRETSRHPEFHVYLNHLARHGKADALARILEDRPRRGRPSRPVEEEFHEVALIEAVIERDGCSARKAVEIARQQYPQVFGHKTERTIENEYSATKDAYRLSIECRWLPGSKVTDFPWSRSDDSRSRR